MSGPGVLRLSDWLGVCRMWLVKLVMRMVVAASAVTGYSMHSVRTLAGDFIFMMLPLGGLDIGFGRTVNLAQELRQLFTISTHVRGNLFASLGTRSELGWKIGEISCSIGCLELA